MKPGPGTGELNHPFDGEARYRLLVESVKDYAIFLLDPGGHVVSWNPGAERIKGYRAEEILGRHFSCFYPPEQAEKGWPDAALRKAAAEGRYEMEGWRVRRDGSRFWADVVVTALRDPEGRLVGFAKVTRDLTARREAEEQARLLAAERAARAAAEAADRSKNDFLTMLAHELRNPLAPILTSVHVLRQPGAGAWERQESLDRLERQLSHLGRLVDDLLDAARTVRGKKTLRRERLDLARLVRAEADGRRALLEAAALTLDVETPPTPVWVFGDPARLTEALANLLDNARKYTGAGGRVGVRLAVDGPSATLTVRDTGVGFPAEAGPHLFAAFAQADRSLERSRGGLGLVVVKGEVESHGGEVTAASEGPGRGAVFTVRLPRLDEPAALAQAATESPARAAPRRILLIEDNRDSAESLRMLLALLGHEVRVALTGQDGLREACSWRPDTVISDIGLPGLDGYEVARRLRAQPEMEGILLIALTGYGRDEDRRKGLAAGFDHYVIKPADPAELLQVLGSAPGH